MTGLYFSANSLVLSAANVISQTREITHSGRNYLVAPVVALKAGVLNGVLVQSDEFGKYAQSWAGRPVPLGHPQANGAYISANSPDVWEAQVPGHFWNVQSDGDALKGEIWIDLEKAQRLGEKAMQIVHRLRAGQPVEVSTGYFADTELMAGVHNGKHYHGIARNIRPDHLALLPDEVGACSWADGCGAPRIHAAGQAPRVNEAAAGEGGAMEERQPEVQAEQEIGLFTRFLGWLGARRASELSSQQEQCMPKTELIAALTANQQCKFSKEKLETWTEGDLQVLQDTFTAFSAGSLADPPKPPEPVPPQPPQPPEPSKPPPAASSGTSSGSPERHGGVSTSLEERLARIEALLTANADQERNELIAGIVVNAATTWTADELRTFSTENLRKLHTAFLPRDYSANGGYFRVSDPEEEELVMHWPIFEKKEG